MAEIVLLDGGMGQELMARSQQPPSPLWSAQVLLEEPELVEAAHRAFLEAGATVITVNAYSATPERLAREGREDLFPTLQDRAVALARQARDAVLAGREATGAAAAGRIAIAGCLPPLVASYRPDLAPAPDQALAMYRRIAAAQADGVDLFLAETLASVDEAVAAATAARETGKPVWVALTLDDDAPTTLRSGEPLSDAMAALADLGVDARLLNCSRPETIDAVWDTFAAAPGICGAYANGFTSVTALVPGGTVDSLEARHDLTPAAHAEVALGWVARGAGIVGGCCEVGPEHIRVLGDRLREAGHTVVAP
ncbi:homocysteine S-methyltransferase [bacterium]|nr:homocysteine S-methyltransferase [bacterium]